MQNFRIEYDKNVIYNDKQKLQEILQTIFNNFNIYNDFYTTNKFILNGDNEKIINIEEYNNILKNKDIGQVINDFYEYLVKFNEELEDKNNFITDINNKLYEKYGNDKLQPYIKI